MSRVYSAMTGTTGTRTVVVEQPQVEATFVATADETPFIEIGGPTGPVFSGAVAKPKVETPRAFPRIAAPVAPAPETPTATFLSVRFHDAVPRVPGRAAEGPDAGLVALHFPEHPVSGEYRTLRDEVTKQLPEATSRVVTFVAATPEAGTTTVMLNLGITLARAGQRVLVLDTNVTRPAIAAKLALRPSPGLAEVFSQHLPLPWALQPTPAPNLQALVAGNVTDDTATAIGRDLPKLLEQLRLWFDWVLIDAGVWGVVPERDATCSESNAVYLVSREADADRPEFTGLKTRVKQLNGHLRGFVTTRL